MTVRHQHNLHIQMLMDLPLVTIQMVLCLFAMSNLLWILKLYC